MQHSNELLSLPLHDSIIIALIVLKQCMYYDANSGTGPKYQSIFETKYFKMWIHKYYIWQNIIFNKFSCKYLWSISFFKSGYCSFSHQGQGWRQKASTHVADEWMTITDFTGSWCVAYRVPKVWCGEQVDQGSEKTWNDNCYSESQVVICYSLI